MISRTRSRFGRWWPPLGPEPDTSPDTRWTTIWRLALLAAAAGVSQAFGRFTYSLLFTDIRDDFAISNTVAGAMGSANLGGYLLGSLVVSLAVGRLGLARTLRIGITGSTASLAALALAPSLAVMFPAMTTAGFFGAFVWITAPGLATASLGAARRGLAIGSTGAGIGVGITGAAALSSIVADDQWRTIYAVEALIAAVVMVLVLFGIPGRSPSGRSEGSGLATIREVPGWQGLLVAYGLFAFALSMVMTFTVALLETDAGWTKPQAALAFSALGIGTIVGGPVFGPMSDRLGRARALVIAFGAVAITGATLPIGLYPLSIFIAFGFGVAFTGVPTTIAARVSDAVPAERFGAAFGAATLAFGVGLLLGPQLGGAVADATDSFRAIFVVVVVTALVGMGTGLRQPS